MAQTTHEVHQTHKISRMIRTAAALKIFKYCCTVQQYKILVRPLTWRLCPHKSRVQDPPHHACRLLLYDNTPQDRVISEAVLIRRRGCLVEHILAKREHGFAQIQQLYIKSRTGTRLTLLSGRAAFVCRVRKCLLGGTLFFGADLYKVPVRTTLCHVLQVLQPGYQRGAPRLATKSQRASGAVTRTNKLTAETKKL